MPKANTSLQIKNLKQTVKYGGGHIIWGCMVREMAFIECKLNAKQWIDVLSDNLSNNTLKVRILNAYYFQNKLHPL